MKYTIAAITLACAFAAQDNTPPVISLNLAKLGTDYDHHNNYYKAGSKVQGNAHPTTTNAYARRCNVVTNGQVAAAQKSCPSPDATAYDKHEEDLTNDIMYSAMQFVTSKPGTRPVKSSRKVGMPNGKLTAAEYANRGEFVLEYNVEDASGNKAEELVFAMIMVDEVKPTIIATNVYTSNKAEACLEPKNTNKKNRCAGTGFTPTATDNYDTTLHRFTYAKSNNGVSYTNMGNVAGATITIDLRALGTRFVRFTATDFADIFGAGNTDNTRVETVQITVVDTTAPRLLLKQFGKQAKTNACSLRPIVDVSSMKDCRLYTLRNNVPRHTNKVCAGCNGNRCFTGGNGECQSIFYGATAIAETWECAVKPAANSVFHANGSPKNTGAWCVDDRKSANSDNTNDESKVTGRATGAKNFNAASSHNAKFRFDYTCSDGNNAATPARRVITIIDTTKPKLSITHLGLQAIRRDTNANYHPHKSVLARKDFKKDPWTDLLTVQHSAGYTEDAPYIKGLVNPGEGYTCVDTCAGDVTHLEYGKKAANLGVKVEWFKCKATNANCCVAAASAKTLKKNGFDTLSVGDWSIVYTCGDGVSGNDVVKCRNIRNEDHAKPIITILDSDQMTFEASNQANYVDAGATCVDEVDGNISQDVEVSGDVVNLARVGTYKIFYNCKDSADNAADTATRTVVVQDTSCPTCNFKSSRKQHQHLTLEASFPYTDQFAKDVHCQDELTASIVPVATTRDANDKVVAEAKITANTGTYFTTYVATDDVGNTNAVGKNGKGGNGCTFQTLDAQGAPTPLVYKTSQYTRTIKVKDTLKPVIKLKLGGTIIKAGSPDSFPTGEDADYQKAAQGFPSPDNGPHTDRSHSWKLMAEETTTSVNGWVLGAIASAVSGLALLGYSLRKQAQPVATSVPV